MSKHDELEKEIVEIRESIAAVSTNSAAAKNQMQESDDLDAYIAALQSQESAPKKSSAAAMRVYHRKKCFLFYRFFMII